MNPFYTISVNRFISNYILIYYLTKTLPHQSCLPNAQIGVFGVVQLSRLAKGQF